MRYGQGRRGDLCEINIHQFTHFQKLMFDEMTDRLTKYFRASSSKSRPMANYTIDNPDEHHSIERPHMTWTHAEGQKNMLYRHASGQKGFLEDGDVADEPVLSEQRLGHPMRRTGHSREEEGPSQRCQHSGQDPLVGTGSFHDEGVLEK
jgi:hypothetical protein